MRKHSVLDKLLLIIVNCASVISTEVANEMTCCECTSMMPLGIRDIQPQDVPSPFVIRIAEEITIYKPGHRIAVNLTSVVNGRKFRSFMIKAHSIDPTRNTDEAIGWFSVLDPSDIVQNCKGLHGAALVNSLSNVNEKTTVRLAWKPYDSYLGNVEFRATFVEDENRYWVREKSRPLFDPNTALWKFQKDTPLYVPPPIPRIDVAGCGSTKGCYRVPENCAELKCEYIFTWRNKGSVMEYEMSALTDGLNDRYFAVGFSKDIYMGKDMVFECVHNSTRSTVEVFQSFKLEGEHTNVRLKNPKVGITSVEGSYNSGRLRCKFTKTKIVQEAEYFDLTNNVYHLLMARGNASNGHIRRHDLTGDHFPKASSDKIDILKHTNSTSGARFNFIDNRACLMLLAWFLLICQ